MQLIKSISDKLRLHDIPKAEKLLCLLIYGSLLGLLIIYTIKKSTFFTSIPIDGAFQHINPLRRIAEGEIPGRDFQVFHGLAISYLHYPIYALFGKTLFASEISRYLINGLCAFAAVLSIFCGLRRPITALGLAAFFIIFTKIIGLFWLTDPFGDAYSALAVRTLTPALCLGYLFYINRKKELSPERTFSQLVIPLILFCSVAMVIATEQGMALLLASAGALVFFHPGQPKWLIRIRDALILCVSTPALYIVIISVLTMGHPGQAINFYLRDLPSDQFWYFGAYPNIFPKNFASLFFVPGTRRPFLNYIVVIVAIALVGFSFFRSRGRVERNEHRIWMLGLGYGCVALISNLGMISSHYSEAVTRIACAILIVFSWTAIERRLSYINISRLKIISLGCMVFIVLFSPYNLKGLIPTSISFAREYRGAILEKHYSGVIPVGAEYRNLFAIAGSVIPPSELLGSQKQDFSASVEESKKYLIFHNPPSALVNLISEGAPIEINGNREIVKQVTPSHLLSTYTGVENDFQYRYESNKLRNRAVSSTPFYSKNTGIWANGISTLPFDKSGCIMVGDPKQLFNVTKYRVIQFANEPFERHITSTYNNILCVDGPPLEPYIHGFPQQLTIKPAIAFSSHDFTLGKDHTSKNAPTVTAEWLYHAEMGSKYHGIHDRDKVDIATKVSDVPALIYHKPNKRTPEPATYFETWSPNSCARDESPTIWSTYTGFLELVSDSINQGNVDYIIHALGKQRRAGYLTDFETFQPVFVHTLRPSYTAYERWIQTATWQFYEDILANYDMVRKTDYSLIWRRKSGLSTTANWVDHPDNLCQSNFNTWVTPRNSWDGELAPNKGSDSLKLGPLSVNLFDREQIYVLEVEYTIDNSLANIPVIGKVARYFIKPISTSTPLPISLPPYENKVTFPIVVPPGKTPTLQFETDSLFGHAEFSVKSIKYRKVLDNTESYREVLLGY